MPETLPKIVISRAVKRHGSVDENAMAVALGSSRIQVVKEIGFVATMALRIMLTEPIVIFLALYSKAPESPKSFLLAHSQKTGAGLLSNSSTLT